MTDLITTTNCDTGTAALPRGGESGAGVGERVTPAPHPADGTPGPALDNSPDAVPDPGNGQPPQQRDYLATGLRRQGAAAAEARHSPNTCPYRAEDSLARLHWLEGYLAVADQPGYGLNRSLAVILRQAVTIARAKPAAGTVVTLGGGL